MTELFNKKKSNLNSDNSNTANNNVGSVQGRKAMVGLKQGSNGGKQQVLNNGEEINQVLLEDTQFKLFDPQVNDELGAEGARTSSEYVNTDDENELQGEPRIADSTACQNTDNQQIMNLDQYEMNYVNPLKQAKGRKANRMKSEDRRVVSQ